MTNDFSFRPDKTFGIGFALKITNQDHESSKAFLNSFLAMTSIWRLNTGCCWSTCIFRAWGLAQGPRNKSKAVTWLVHYPITVLTLASCVLAPRGASDRLNVCSCDWLNGRRCLGSPPFNFLFSPSSLSEVFIAFTSASFSAQIYNIKPERGERSLFPSKQQTQDVSPHK